MLCDIDLLPKMGSKWAAWMMLSTLITAKLEEPSSRYDGLTIHMPFTSLGWSARRSNQWISAHEKNCLSIWVKEKKQYTRPTSMLSIPSFVSSVLTKMQSYHGVPCSQAGVAWMTSRRMLLIPDRSLGETKVATAEWKILMRPVKGITWRVRWWCWTHSEMKLAMSLGMVGIPSSTPSDTAFFGRLRACKSVSESQIRKTRELTSLAGKLHVWMCEPRTIIHSAFQVILPLVRKFNLRLQSSCKDVWLARRPLEKRYLLVDAAWWERGSILWASKLAREAAGNESRWLVWSICPMALCLLDHCQGFFTAVMCFDSVIDVHSPFGAPNKRISDA